MSVPDEVYRRASEVAARQNISVERLVAGALLDQLVIWERFQKLGGESTRDGFLEALSHVPDVEPEEHDRR
ncbi:MAG: hypothetical protein ACKV22_22110 [Bryobacteraceae bacterium]